MNRSEQLEQAKRSLGLKRRELYMAGMKLGAAANVRGRRPGSLSNLEQGIENAARAFAAAEADVRIVEALSEEDS